ncbi:hypothetical protein Q1695_005072 [Nippostrongylus brasiliensis]|nr:hypothetical protein Q1695_005072 [Nippostrongylus brasiliensis]
MGRKKKSRGGHDDVSDTESDSSVSRSTRDKVLPSAAVKRQQVIPGALLKPRHQPPWYSARILEEERPDLAGAEGKLHLEREEAALMDNFIRSKSDLQIGDLIITDDNLDEDDRKFNRYEVQLKYNEGRYTALYLISRQVCQSNETVEKSNIFGMKTSIRPYSVNILLRMKRELRILNELKKKNCPFSPIVLDSGRVGDLPFIVMNLLDRNIEKLREQVGSFRPATAFYIAHEALSAIAFVHSLKYIHRDVKLTNICIGANPNLTRIFLIDYGDTVKLGKKIKYGTPDIYTLPYWSVDAHKRNPASEKGDAESWLYVLIDLFARGSLPWYKMTDEAKIKSEKQRFWRGKSDMPDSPHIYALYNLIRKSDKSFDHQQARRMTREGIEHHLKGRPLTLEWAPNACVRLAPLTGKRVVNLSERPLARSVTNTEKDTDHDHEISSPKIRNSTETIAAMPDFCENAIPVCAPGEAKTAMAKQSETKIATTKPAPPEPEPMNAEPVKAEPPVVKRKSKSRGSDNDGQNIAARELTVEEDEEMFKKKKRVISRALPLTGPLPQQGKGSKEHRRESAASKQKRSKPVRAEAGKGKKKGKSKAQPTKTSGSKPKSNEKKPPSKTKK